LLAVHIVPLWIFRFFPSQDGPAHLENANIIRQYFGPHQEVIRQYYFLNPRLHTNCLAHLVMAILLVFLPPWAVEKILLSSCVVLLPFSARYALRAFGPEAGFLSVLVWPFGFSWLLHMGFYNFCLSLPLFFLTVGYWMRHESDTSVQSVARLFGLGLILYSAHIVSLGPVLLGTGFLGIARTTRESWPLTGPMRRDFSFGALRARALVWSLGLLPSLLFASLFVSRRGATFGYDSFQNLWEGLRELRVLATFSDSEFLLTGGLLWLFVLTTAYAVFWAGRPRPIWGRWSFFGLSLIFLCIYFLAPRRLSGGFYLNERLVFFPFFTLVLALGEYRFAPLVRGLVQIAGASLALGLLVQHGIDYRRFQADLEEYVSTEASIHTDNTLLSLNYLTRPETELARRAPGVEVFLNVAGRIAADRNVLDLTNYEGHYDYFPVQFRPGLDPYREIGPQLLGMNLLYRGEGCVDFQHWSAKTGKTLDYVLVWGLGSANRQEECVRSVMAQLRQGYALVFTSARGQARLYRRRDGADGGPP